jgi:O-antigen ligase
MLINFNNEIRSENFTKFIALCLVIPAYMDFFVSKAPLFQFIGYLSYLIPLGILFIHQKINVSKKFIIYWAIFSILLIMPSIINLSSGRLESDLINLKGLFSKWIFLSALMLFFDTWLKKYRTNQWLQLIYYLFLFMLPMMTIIFFKVFAEVCECPKELFHSSCRPIPFGVGAFITSELFLLFGLLCLALKNHTLKIILIGFSLMALILLQSRTALFGLILAYSFYTILPMLFKYKKRVMIPFILVGLILSFYIFNSLVDHTFIGRNLSTFTNRLHMWQLGIETIQAHPWLGIGFDVTPNYYGFLDHANNTIHNMFIRLATENGLPLLLLIVLTLIFSIIRLFKSKDYFAIAVLLSVIIFHSFSTRHISINLMNIIFYIIIMRSFYVSRIKS